jgi:hypothetical protein
MAKIHRPLCHPMRQVATRLLVWHIWPGWWRFDDDENFGPSLLFSLICIGFQAELLKIQMYHSVCICSKFGSRSFDFYLF